MDYLTEYEEEKHDNSLLKRISNALFIVAVIFWGIIILSGIYRLLAGHDFNINDFIQ